MRTLLSLGHGYSARCLSAMLAADGGWRVIGTTRSGEEFAAIADAGAEPRIWPGSDLAADLATATHVLVSIAPSDDGDPVLRALSAGLARIAGKLSWAGYLSTTAVYGDRRGGWVDESSRLLPSTRRGKLRVQAEGSWRELSARSGLPLHIFRLAGIYGPGRGPLHQLLNGRRTRIVRSGQYFNRIHVGDIARILRASMQCPDPGSVYNVCDDCPARADEVFEFAAGLTGLPVPEKVDLAQAELSEMARSFYMESKKVHNRKVKAQLSMSLDYPDYRRGMTALARGHDRRNGRLHQ